MSKEMSSSQENRPLVEELFSKPGKRWKEWTAIIIGFGLLAAFF